MKVLQICLKPPLPANDGGCKAMNNITMGLLARDIPVKVLTIATPKHPFLLDQMPDEYLKSTGIEHVFVDTKINVFEAFWNLFSKTSYNIERFINKEFESLIIKTLKAADYDVVLLESLYVTPYVEVIRAHSRAKIVYRSHNIEHKIWELKASKSSALKKSYLNLLSRRLKEYETNLLGLVDGVLPITTNDEQLKKELGCQRPMQVVPFGIDAEQYAKYEKEAATFFHIGSMDWEPNVQGIEWLLKKVWPKVMLECPEAKLVLAGRNMPTWLRQLAQNGVEVVGEVDDALEFISNQGTMLVPLFVGSGMRVKIIEAMAIGKPVISTAIGAEGIHFQEQKEIVVANDAEAFCQAIIDFYQNEQTKTEVARRGQVLVQKNYDNRRIVDNLVIFLKEL